MAREIKFRAWDTSDKEKRPYMLGPYDLTDAIWAHTEIRKMPLMQYTGLKDKNGKEIYEADVFQVAGNKIYTVVFCEGGVSNHEWYGGAFVLKLNNEIFFPFDEFAMSHGEVIGNIYENPELLTK